MIDPDKREIIEIYKRIALVLLVGIIIVPPAVIITLYLIAKALQWISA